jgi:sugar O-acyltransferase (sialic acid O-acetyltransferase NeuD family)
MIYLYGAGGHGKVALDALQKSGLKCSGFIDDNQFGNWSGLPVIKSSSIPNNAELHLSIGNSHTREKLAGLLNSYQFLTIKHPMSSIADTASISNEGSLITALSVVGPDAKIGAHTIVNHGAVVDHDCTVGDYCHIAPNAVLGGNVSIGKHVLIGAGAVVLPGLTITDNVTIGAGAIVTHDVKVPSILVGVPAKPIGLQLK